MDGPQKTVVPVLLRGLDEKAPRQVGVTGMLDVLRNYALQKAAQGGYEFVPRPGSSLLPKTADSGTISSGMRLNTLGAALVLMTGTSCYRKASDQWHLVAGAAPVVGVGSRTFGSGAVSTSSADAAVVNGYTLQAEAYFDGKTYGVLVQAVDASGVVTLSTVVASSTTNPFRGVRVAVSGTQAVVFWGPTSTPSLLCAKFDSASPGTIGAPVTVAASIDSGILFDVQTVGATGKIAVLYAAAGINQKLVTVSSMAVSAATTYGGLVNVLAFGYLTNDYSTTVIYFGTISFTAGLQLTTTDGATLALGATTTYDAASTGGFNVTGNRVGGAATIYFTTSPAPPPGVATYDYLIKSSSGAAAVVVRRSVMLASRAVPFGGSVYALAQYRSPGSFAASATALSASYFLLDLVASVEVGKALDDVGTPNFYDSIALPNLQSTSGNRLVTAAIKVVAVETDNGQFAPYTSGAVVTFTMQDTSVGKGVELGGDLMIPGAMPYIFDGLQLVDQGFPIAGEIAASSTPAGGGGMTSGAVYTYREVDEWVDYAGNLWQSAPSPPWSVTMGATDTQVTHSLPTTRVTRKTSISKVIYRTPANGDGSVYFRVSSTISPIANDPTVDRVSFVDTVSDATAAAGQPLYTTGGVLENVALPACKTVAVHRGRILAAGIEGDPDAIWFSKEVPPATGIEFNDALVSRITSVEPVTAVGSMDAYAIACTSTQTWASSNDYPDDTGSSGVLQFLQQSSMTGCATVGLTGRNDQGVILYGGQAKGFWRMSRGLSFDYVGAQVEDDAQGFAPCAILAVPSQNQVRVVAGRTVFVHESVYGQWAIWDYQLTPAVFVDAAILAGVAYYLCTDGTVVQEQSGGTYDDNSTPNSVRHSITLSGLNLAGVAGYWRLYVTQFTGRCVGDGNGFTLNADQSFDETGIPTKSITYDGSEAELDAEVDPGTMGKCSRYDLTITDSNNHANSAFTLAAVTLLMGIKRGLSKLPPARRMT
jgi:hypothetical protein